jgi:hypothetical protein
MPLPSNPQIGEWIDKQTAVLENRYIETGSDMSYDIYLHLKEEKRAVDGNEVTELVWIASPVYKATGKRISSATLGKVIDKHVKPLGKDVIKNIADIFYDHEDFYLKDIAAPMDDVIDPEKWMQSFNKSRSRFYRADRENRWYEISLNANKITEDARSQAFNIVQAGIHENANPDTLVREMREKVFGLKPGERNKGVTYKATRIVRSELAYAESEIQKELMRQNPEIIGVTINYYGGPCPSGECVREIKRGRNVQFSGEDVSADFYFRDGEIHWPPYHPHCYCSVVAHLYQSDWDELMGRAA